MAQTWSSHDLLSWVFLNLNQCANGCSKPNFTLNPVAPFPRNGQNMALLWPKHGCHIILKIGYSQNLNNVAKKATCQFSHLWVYPVAPFPRYSQNMALSGP